jgi:hypothetical protein
MDVSGATKGRNYLYLVSKIKKTFHKGINTWQ